jgi:hypothetical protein
MTIRGINPLGKDADCSRALRDFIPAGQSVFEFFFITFFELVRLKKPPLANGEVFWVLGSVTRLLSFQFVE